jgi:AraC-like DNA-binding protein
MAMPRKVLDAFHVSSLYESGESILAIAKLLGCSTTPVRRCLLDSGVQLRTKAASTKLCGLKQRLTVENLHSLAGRYIEGESMKSLADEAGVARNVLALRFSEQGIQLRGRAAAEKVKWAVLRTDREAVERQCSAAWEAARGRTHSTQEKLQRARTHYKRRLRVFTHETRITELLRFVGFQTAQQLNVGFYNVDIAVGEPARIAVEIMGCSPSEFVKTNQRHRLMYLLDRKWFVIIVRWSRVNKLFSDVYVLQQLISLFDKASWDKSVFGKYRMILSHPKYVPIRGFDLDGVPVVE